MSEFQTHQQLILRVPPLVAENIGSLLSKKGVDTLAIEVIPEEGRKPYFSLQLGEERFPAVLGNLPCNIETHKTYDHTTYYKSGDIGQVHLHHFYGHLLSSL